jgi:arginyl-tRNA synthetase
MALALALMKDVIVKLVAKEVGMKVGEVERLVEVPPKDEMGDFAFPCFGLAKKLRKNPMLIAEELAEKLRKDLKKTDISNVDFKGAYVNFFVDKKALAKRVLARVSSEQLAVSSKKNGKKVIEFPSPNTNKPLHLGHLRNMAIGASVAKILEFAGNDVVRVNLNNDRGVHICKSMVAYEKFGKGAKPDKKSDHFVGDYYVKFNDAAKKDKKLEVAALDCLKKWEAGDRETVALWKKMNKWAFDGFAETYDLFGVKFDKEYFESELYKKGKEIIDAGLKKGVFVKGKDGEVKIDLSKEKLGEKVLLRADGTALYMVQDLYLAKLKDEDFMVDGSIYVVGNEQNYHFKVLFSILKKLGFKFADKLYHLSYGMVNLPEGRMKSREGTIVDADDLIEKTRKLAEKGLVTRGAKLSKKELGERSLKIALAAIKYNLLKIDIRKNMVFNPKEAIAFEGDTGPYLLYSYARASSIVRKVKSKKRVKILDLKSEEIRLLKKIDSFGEVVGKAYGSLAPNLVANYCYELAQMFNEFYHACPVLGSAEEGFRLALVSKFRETLGNGLGLLGIDVVEEM